MRLPKAGSCLSPRVFSRSLRFSSSFRAARRAARTRRAYSPVLGLGAFALADGGEPGGQVDGADCGR